MVIIYISDTLNFIYDNFGRQHLVVCNFLLRFM